MPKFESIKISVMPNPLTYLNQLGSQMALYNNQNAYMQLFKLLFPTLFKFSLCVLNSRELAKEVASDLMISL
ncbi:hypothetical protein ACVWYG_000528 [Pedobacter sp. UYEF25]